MWVHFFQRGIIHAYKKNRNYDLLSVEFKQVIDSYIKHEKKRGKLEDTIYTESHNAACFLQRIHETGIITIGKITEKSVLDFFYDGEKINHLYDRLRKITVPVFFRLLYSSGVRTCEARLYERKDVDLEQGVVSVI